ncbi:carbon-nitrogen hydrolase family protein [Glaciecola sp. XM2]|jgi:predicted amidohydrolase|uniref:carbon-nitrogen hydrolase family protein n=1 Tax=Glaciecola sp. XM2 TaxID=1914931 RepID=UPI001BDF38F5|nr:carbon-nitrogen hydrolase family protein [Glaciecola sp. XM2]MBT1451675.1 carbon-nitrogen hydrolase family protein [Glaciecola sp. XM2]
MADLIALQMNTSADLASNMRHIESQLKRFRQRTDAPALAVLPECAPLFGCNGALQLASAEPYGDGPIQRTFSELAQRFNLYLVAGTMPLVSPESHRYYAASLVYAPDGKCVSRYHKIHLFDVEVNDKTKAYQESKYTYPGSYISRFASPWGDVGQSVCYDLRFPSMFTAMMPMNILVVPSAFTKVTGKAHWHALLRSRSIELQCYVIAANQVGVHADGRETFGHSCIYSPWGELLSVVEKEEGFASATFDLERLTKIRQNMPVFTHTQERYEFE